MGKKKMEIEEFEEDEKFSDEYDVIEHLSKIHSNNTGLSTDFVLAKSDEAFEDYATKQVLIARALKEYIKDPYFSQLTYDTIVAECTSRIILKRNNESNWLVRLFGERNPRTDEEEPANEGRMTKILKMLKKDDTKE